VASRQISDEEIQLKKRARHRLIGAIILVVVAVVVLPLVLDDKPPSVGEEIAIEIPDPLQNGEFTSRIVPVDPKKTAKSSAASPTDSTQQAVTEEKPRAAGVEKAAAPAKKTSVAPAKSAAKQKIPAVASGQGFVVQLGAFSNVTNAQELHQRLKAQGIHSYSEPLKTAQGDKTRVRAGPFASREEAEKALAKLKAMGVNGVVVENKG
jgi:DedD protein